MARNQKLAFFMDTFCPLAMASEGCFSGPWVGRK